MKAPLILLRIQCPFSKKSNRKKRFEKEFFIHLRVIWKIICKFAVYFLRMQKIYKDGGGNKNTPG